MSTAWAVARFIAEVVGWVIIVAFLYGLVRSIRLAAKRERLKRVIQAGFEVSYAEKDWPGVFTVDLLGEAWVINRVAGMYVWTKVPS